MLGKTFTERGLAAARRHAARRTLEPLLAALVRKEVLSLQTDPRSPEHGQYGFLQDLVRQSPTRRSRGANGRTRHLAAARVPRAERSARTRSPRSIAAHYLAASRGAPGRRRRRRDHVRKARDCARRARASARRRSQLGRGAALLRAAPPSSPTSRVDAGDAARPGGAGGAGLANLPVEGRALLERAHACSRGGDRRAPRSCPPGSPSSTTSEGHAPQAVARLESALEALAEREPDAHVAAVAGQLGRFLVLSGEGHRAAPHIEQALEIAERLDLPERSLACPQHEGLIRRGQGSPERSSDPARRRARDRAGARAPLRGAPRVQQPRLGARAAGPDTPSRIALAEQALALARRVGDRGPGESCFGANGVYPLYLGGRWDEAVARAEEFEEAAIASAQSQLSLSDADLRPHAARLVRTRARNWWSRLTPEQLPEDPQGDAARPRLRGARPPRGGQASRGPLPRGRGVSPRRGSARRCSTSTSRTRLPRFSSARSRSGIPRRQRTCSPFSRDSTRAS